MAEDVAAGSRTDPAKAGVPWRSRTVQLVLLSTAVAPLGVPLVSPTLPVFRDAFGVTAAQASLLVSGYFVVGILLSPFVGLLADRLGRKRVLVGGLTTFGVLGGAMAFAPSFEVVMLLRVLQGTGAAAIFITTVTIIGDTFEDAQRTAVLGVNVAVLSATAALFPVLGGTLVSISWNAPFLTYFAAVPLAVAVALLLEEPATGSETRGVEHLRSALASVATPAVLALFGITFLTEFLAFGVVFTTLPFLLEPVLAPVFVGAVILSAEAVSMVAATATGRLARRFSSVQLVALGFACYGIGFSLIGLSGRLGTIVLGVVFAGAGIGLLLPSIDASLSERTTEAHRAGTFSLRNSATFSGRFAGPVTFAGLAVTAGLGYTPLLLAAGSISVAMALATAVVARRSGRGGLAALDGSETVR
jgi:MFS family permease